MAQDRPPRRGWRWAGLILAGVLFAGGGGLTALGLVSRAQARDALASERKALAEARSDLEEANDDLDAARESSRESASEARAVAALGRRVLNNTEQLVDLNRRQLDVARDMKAAGLGGRYFDFNDLVDDLNQTAAEAEVLSRKIRRLFL